MNRRQDIEASIRADGIDDDEGVELMRRMQNAERAGDEHEHELDAEGEECWFCGASAEDMERERLGLA